MNNLFNSLLMKQAAHLFLMLSFLMLLQGCYKDEEKRDKKVTKKDIPEVLADYNLIGQLITTNTSDDLEVFFNGEMVPLLDDQFFYSEAQLADKYREVITVRIENIELPYITPMIENSTNYAKLALPHNTNSIDLADGSDVLDLESSVVSITPNSYQKNGEAVTNGSIYFTSFSNNQGGNLPGGVIGVDKGEQFYCDIDALIVIQSDEVDAFEATWDGLTNDLLKYDKAQRLWVRCDQINGPGMYCSAITYKYDVVTGQLSFQQQKIGGLTFTLKNQVVQTNSKGQYIAYLLPSASNIATVSTCNSEEIMIQYSNNEAAPLDVAFDTEMVEISGRLNNCENQNITDGLVRLSGFEATQVYKVDGPEYRLNVPVCDENQLEITVFANDFTQSSPTFKVDRSPEVELHDIHLCSSLNDEFGYLKIDGEDLLLLDVEAVQENGRIKLNLETDNGNMNVWMSEMRAGFYNDSQLNVSLLATLDNGIDYELNCSQSLTGCGFETFDVIEYGANRGDYIRIFFEGRFWMKIQDNETKAGYRDVIGSVHVKRSF